MIFQTHQIVDNVVISETENKLLVMNLETIVYRELITEQHAFREIKPYRLTKKIFEPIHYTYRPQMFSLIDQYKIVPYDQRKMSDKGIWNAIDIHHLSLDKRISNLQRFAAMVCGWINYDVKHNGYYQTLPFLAGQRFLAFKILYKAKEAWSRYLHTNRGEDLVVYPFDILDANFDYHNLVRNKMYAK